MLYAKAVHVSVRTLYANVYLLTTPQGRLLIDAGVYTMLPSFMRILQQFSPHALLITHAHLDHVGGAAWAAGQKIPVLAHPLEIPILCGQQPQAKNTFWGNKFAGLQPRPTSERVYPIAAGEEVLGWQVVALAGHTKGQIGVLRDGVLVAADAVINIDGMARLPSQHYNEDHAEAFATLRHIHEMDLRAILPGHGAALRPSDLQIRLQRPS